MNTTSQTSSFNLANYIDVARYYAELVLRRWPIIVAAGLIAGILIFLLRSLSPETYTSRADVVMLIVRTTYEPADNSNDPQISSRDSVVSNYLDDSRWTGLVAQANNSTVIFELKNETYAQFEAQLIENDIKRRNFGLTTDVAQRGDVLRLSVTHSDPEIATWAANRWADKFVEYANRTYITTGETPETVAQYVDQAFQEYTSAASAVAEYQLTSQLGELERRHEKLTNLLTEYVNREYDAFLLLNANRLTNNNDSLERLETVAVLNKMNELARQRLNNSSTPNLSILYAQRNALNSLEVELSLIQSQIESGVVTDALQAGNYIALMFARANNQLGSLRTTGTSSSAVNVEVNEETEKVRYTDSDQVSSAPTLALSLDLSNLSESTPLTAESVAQLLDAVRNRRTELNAAIDAEINAWFTDTDKDFLLTEEADALIQDRVNDLLNPSELIMPEDIILTDSQLYKNMSILDEELRNLEVQRNQLRLQQDLLYREREAARDQYKLLLEKLNEVSAFDALGNTQVRRAPFLAVPPEKPNPRGRTRSAMFAAVGASSLAILAVVAWDGWLKANSNQSATTKSNKESS